ncbi:uncharacterized protein LOC117124973 [Anneissia japonica]|uniref:uncharacterized protein LOC117124973 n=1 Tax=Anneissia japonica TaxID=1529436 RepID=UPI0014257946|nr:uncharacterized protein LOC117124973 [Anneissia japonica]
MLSKKISKVIFGLLTLIKLGSGIPVYRGGARHPLRTATYDRLIEHLFKNRIERHLSTQKCAEQDLIKQQHTGIAIDISQMVDLENFDSSSSSDSSLGSSASLLRSSRSSDDRNQSSLMVLTETQKMEVLSVYGSYFQNSSRMAANEESTVAIHTDSIATKRESGPFKVEVCPRVETWETLYLAKTEDGKLVQIVQFPENGMEQWFLNEDCSAPVSNVINNVSCEVRTRLVQAIVIDQKSSSVKQQHIQVKSCAAHTFL